MTVVSCPRHRRRRRRSRAPTPSPITSDEQQADDPAGVGAHGGDSTQAPGVEARVPRRPRHSPTISGGSSRIVLGSGAFTTRPVRAARREARRRSRRAGRRRASGPGPRTSATPAHRLEPVAQPRPELAHPAQQRRVVDHVEGGQRGGRDQRARPRRSSRDRRAAACRRAPARRRRRRRAARRRAPSRWSSRRAAPGAARRPTAIPSSPSRSGSRRRPAARPAASQASRAAAITSSAITWTPASPWIGSSITAAVRSPTAARRASGSSRGTATKPGR